MKKNNFLFCLYITCIFLVFNENSFSQVDTIANDLFLDNYLGVLQTELTTKGIDPFNEQQILDSLNSGAPILLDALIEYCGKGKVISAIPKLREMLNTLSFYGNSQVKSKLLMSLIELGDKTIFSDLRNGIDSLLAFDYNSAIAEYSYYLMLNENDDYGWPKLKKMLADDPSINMSIHVSKLVAFYNQEHSIEIDGLLEHLILNAAESEMRSQALITLSKTNNIRKEQLIFQAACNDNDKYNRMRARNILKNMNSFYYISALHQALSIENEKVTRQNLYKEIINTTSPAEYKYLSDIYLSNFFPNDSIDIKFALERGTYLTPPEISIYKIIDTITFGISYFGTAGWIGDNNYIAELQSCFYRAKEHISHNDTNAVIHELDIFMNKIDSELRDTLNLTNAFISKSAWRYLYPMSYYLKQKISTISGYGKLFFCVPTFAHKSNNNIDMVIRGYGFNSTSQLYFDNYWLPLNIISDSVITCTISTKYLSKPIAYNINVYNELTLFLNALTFEVLSSEIVLSPSLTFPNSGGFTLAVEGQGFTSASKVLWNNSARTTTFVSDSLLRANILATDVAAAGDYYVRVQYDSTSSAVSDSMVFSVVTTLPKPIRLVIERETDNKNGTMTAWFGYLNVNDKSVYIPVGEKNSFMPTPIEKGQTTLFLPGRHKYAFSVTFPSTINVEWQLNDRQAKAGSACED